MYGNAVLLVPVLLPVVLAFVAYFFRSTRARSVTTAAAAALELVVFALLFCSFTVRGEALELAIPGVCGMDMLLCADGFRLVFGALSALMWLLAALSERACLEETKSRGRLSFFMLITLGAVAGIFLSADLFTTFIYFEIMSLASWTWVAHDETPEAMRAGGTYLFIGVLGGMVMLMGLFLLYRECGTLVMAELTAAAAGADSTRLFIAGVCLLFGFGAKAGAFPLHVWLPRSYVAAPAPATALLSSILSKTGLFGIIVISMQLFGGNAAWAKLILVLGVITMLLGAGMAVLSVNLKRTLACSSMSQVGFILVGVGMSVLLGDHGSIAARGTVMHMINHSLIKMLLFTAAGMLFKQHGTLELNELRGAGRVSPVMTVCFAVGALSVAGVPLFGGYVSKTLIHEGIVEYVHLLAAAGESTVFYSVVEWLFIIAGGLTLAYMTKIFVAVFVEKPARKAQPVSRGWLLTVPAVLLMLIGLVPGLTADSIADLSQSFMTQADIIDVHYFSLVNLRGAAYSIVIGVLVYLLFVRRVTMKNGSYVNLVPAWAELESGIYRPLLKLFDLILGAVAAVLDRYILDPCVSALRAVMSVGAKLLDQYFLPPVIAFSVAFGRGFSRLMMRVSHCLDVMLRSAAYQELAPEERSKLRIRLIHFSGCAADFFVMLLNRTVWRKKPHKVIYRKSMDELAETNFTNTHIIGRSLSFGLLMVCTGICVTLLYILVAGRYLK